MWCLKTQVLTNSSGDVRSDCTLNVIPSLGGRVLMPLTDGGMQYLIGGLKQDLLLIYGEEINSWQVQAASRTPARCQSKPGHQEGQIPLRGQSGRGPQSFRRSLSYNRSHARVRVAANKACGGLHVCRVFVCPIPSTPIRSTPQFKRPRTPAELPNICGEESGSSRFLHAGQGLGEVL